MRLGWSSGKQRVFSVDFAIFWKITHHMLLTAASAFSALQGKLINWPIISSSPSSALAITFLRNCYDPRLSFTSSVVKDTTDVSSPDLFRSFFCHPELMFALIKLIFLSAFIKVSSTCGLNDSDLSSVTPSNLGVLLNCIIFSPLLLEGFQSNSALDRVNNVD